MNRRRARNLLLGTLGVASVLLAATYIAFQVSPWPSALLLRVLFNRDAQESSQALARHLPGGVTAWVDEHYDMTDPDAYLDVYYPSEIEDTERVLPTVVWVHGGAWIAGSKDYIANYLKILAGRGYTVVGVDYSLAPGKTYPTPVRQVFAALSYLETHAQRFHVDSSEFVLAGDSGGAQIAAQVATVVSNRSYASAVGIVPSIHRSQLAAVILYCGAYDIDRIDLEGPYGFLLRTALWSYTGEKNFRSDPRLLEASVIHHVTAAFPPMFISGGNADPLTPQSRAFAAVVGGFGVHVDSLFFPENYTPPLPHEYQFNLDTDAGRLALGRSVAFLSHRSVRQEDWAGNR